MAKTKTQPDISAKLQQQRIAWIARVTALVKQISEWSTAQGWTVQTQPKSISEAELGTYTVPEAVVKLDAGELIITPIAFHVADGSGRVDLEAIPTLARVKLIGGEGGWQLYADPNIPLRLKWNRANFAQLAKDLLS